MSNNARKCWWGSFAVTGICWVFILCLVFPSLGFGEGRHLDSLEGGGEWLWTKMARGLEPAHADTKNPDPFLSDANSPGLGLGLSVLSADDLRALRDWVATDWVASEWVASEWARDLGSGQDSLHPLLSKNGAFSSVRGRVRYPQSVLSEYYGQVAYRTALLRGWLDLTAEPKELENGRALSYKYRFDFRLLTFKSSLDSRYDTRVRLRFSRGAKEVYLTVEKPF